MGCCVEKSKSSLRNNELYLTEGLNNSFKDLSLCSDSLCSAAGHTNWRIEQAFLSDIFGSWKQREAFDPECKTLSTVEG